MWLTHALLVVSSPVRPLTLQSVADVRDPSRQAVLPYKQCVRAAACRLRRERDDVSSSTSAPPGVPSL
ncbi:hypothetical protein NDU88_007665 [Pleurodeles waltl]|uniref:Secreted protein n=1 Tax=Pleurodeles waltl TaxID=8319 RepID=A0AAV7STB5_PLEWA|nr:hypothetical protein NDU88_007665 [Pleurodeles waltl]